MKTNKLLLGLMLIGLVCITSCGDQAGKTDDNTNDTTAKAPSVKEEQVSYSADTAALTGYVAYDANSDAKRPVVLVVHEWWGLGDYVRNRAKQLAEMGYLAMAVDMFGNGKLGNNPQEAQALVTPFYQNPQLAKTRLHAAVNKIKEFKQADTSNIAAIGYCFGGTVVLNAAKLGEDLKGVVSFHGGLAGPPADKNLLKAKVLVCHGSADNFVPQPEVDRFRKQMDSIGADYTFKVYDSATHAFTNPDATEKGKQFNLPIKYDPEADRRSWEDMKAFFGRVFPQNNDPLRK